MKCSCSFVLCSQFVLVRRRISLTLLHKCIINPSRHCCLFFPNFSNLRKIRDFSLLMFSENSLLPAVLLCNRSQRFESFYSTFLVFIFLCIFFFFFLPWTENKKRFTTFTPTAYECFPLWLFVNLCLNRLMGSFSKQSAFHCLRCVLKVRSLHLANVSVLIRLPTSAGERPTLCSRSC